MFISTDPANELIVSSNTGAFIFNEQLHLISKIEAGYTVEDTKTKAIGFASISLHLNKDTVLILTSKGVVCYSEKTKDIDYLKHSSDLFCRQIATMLDDSIREYSPGVVDENVFFFIPNYRVTHSVFLADFNSRTLRAVPSSIDFRSEMGWQSWCSRINDSTFFLNGAENGYFVFHYSAEKKTIFAGNKKLLPRSPCHLFYIDKDQRLWCCTWNGLLKQSFSKELFNSTWLDSSLNQSRTEINGFYRKGDLLYVGLANWQTGLATLDSHNHLLNKIDLRPYSQGGNAVWTLVPWSGDTIAVPTQSGLLFYATGSNTVLKPESKFPAIVNSVPVTNIFRDSHNHTWLGLGLGNGVLLYDNATRMTKQYFPGISDTSFRLRYPNCIAEDTAGNIWFAHKGQGITRWNCRTQQFDTLITSFKNEGIDDFDFVCLNADKQGNLWIGFSNYGLMKLNTATGERRMYTLKNGLASNTIVNLFTGVTGQVWLIYPYGLGVLNTETGRIKNFSIANGLPNYTATSLNFFYDTPVKKLMIGFENSFVSFDPFAVAAEKGKQKVHITEIENPYDSLSFGPDEQVALKYDQNNISISFSAINYDNSADISYEYRLYKNENTPWVNVLHQQTVSLILSPGDYTFQVRVVGDDASIATRQISISFPYYETWWFYTICGAVVLVGLYSLYRYRINQLLRVQKVRNRISADLHDDIGARLTNINLLSALGEQKLTEPEQASAYLRRISDEVQNSGEALDDIVWSINTKNDSVEEITTRMRRYAANIFDHTNIYYTIIADENVLSVKLSMEKRRDLFLVYKEAINNIFKHAMASKVQISVEVKGANLVMQISDNGKGFDMQKPTHRNGLKNIRYRIEKSGGNVTIQSAVGKGTSFIIKLPHSEASLKRSIFNWFIKNSFVL